LGERLEDIQGSITKAGENSRVEVVAPETPAPQPATLGPALGQYLEGLQEVIKTLAERPVQSTAPSVSSAPGAVPQASTINSDIGKYLEGLQDVIKAIAERPVQVTASGFSQPGQTSAPAAPVPMPRPSQAAQPPIPPPPLQVPAPVHQAIETIAPVNPIASELDAKVVPALRRVAELIRGPHSKTILLDGRLVDAFDALRDAEDMDDVLRALKPLKRNGKTS